MRRASRSRRAGRRRRPLHEVGGCWVPCLWRRQRALTHSRSWRLHSTWRRRGDVDDPLTAVSAGRIRRGGASPTAENVGLCDVPMAQRAIGRSPIRLRVRLTHPPSPRNRAADPPQPCGWRRPRQGSAATRDRRRGPRDRPASLQRLPLPEPGHARGRTPEEWDATVARMETNGMVAPANDVYAVIDDLSKALPPG